MNPKIPRMDPKPTQIRPKPIFDPNQATMPSDVPSMFSKMCTGPRGIVNKQASKPS